MIAKSLFESEDFIILDIDKNRKYVEIYNKHTKKVSRKKYENGKKKNQYKIKLWIIEKQSSKVQFGGSVVNRVRYFTIDDNNSDNFVKFEIR
jgi:anti-sigma-K factor RskA